MKYRFTALVLVLALLLGLCGCSEAVGEIASNVADAAVKELEVQVKKTLEKYKVDVIEVKSAVGKLNNDSDSDLQFFCGVLVRSNSDSLPQSCASALGKLFEQAGVHGQTGSEVDSEYLVHKTITFKHTDFSSGDYYLIWAYSSSLTQKLSELELPTIPEGWLPTELVEGIG